jgi:hypothetical protein
MRRSQPLASWNKRYFVDEAHLLRFRERPLHAKSPHCTKVVNATIDPENSPLDAAVEREQHFACVIIYKPIPKLFIKLLLQK